MSIVCLEGATLEKFVEDSEAFNRCVDEQFDKLDVKGEGVLSRSSFEKRPGRYGSMEFELQSKEEIGKIYDTIFNKFDADRKGTIDRKGFGLLMREIMLAKARGLGSSPILMILQGDGLVIKAVEHGLKKSGNYKGKKI
ncbi:hypothetical protein NMG60_11029673 [Bertholletia excelsa]